MRLLSLAFLALLVLPPSARSEYRVHILEIRNVDTGATREVASTLDHFQYPEYHPVGRRELVTLKDHWMCFGRTEGHKPPCPSPQPPAPPEELQVQPVPLPAQ